MFLNIDSQGEEGFVEVDNVDYYFMDILLMLMVVYCVWLCVGKINVIFV